MGLSLIMKRQVFAIIQSLAVDYEEKFGKRKGLTPLITNQLLAEALISRGLLPENFLEDEYGSLDPLGEGFSYRGFRSGAVKKKRAVKTKVEEESELKKVETQFSRALAQWDLHPSEEWRSKWIKHAEKYAKLVPKAQLILDKADPHLKEALMNEP